MTIPARLPPIVPAREAFVASSHMICTLPIDSGSTPSMESTLAKTSSAISASSVAFSSSTSPSGQRTIALPNCSMYTGLTGTALAQAPGSTHIKAAASAVAAIKILTFFIGSTTSSLLTHCACAALQTVGAVHPPLTRAVLFRIVQLVQLIASNAVAYPCRRAATEHRNVTPIPVSKGDRTNSTHLCRVGSRPPQPLQRRFVNRHTQRGPPFHSSQREPTAADQAIGRSRRHHRHHGRAVIPRDTRHSTAQSSLVMPQR